MRLVDIEIGAHIDEHMEEINHCWLGNSHSKFELPEYITWGFMDGVGVQIKDYRGLFTRPLKLVYTNVYMGDNEAG